MRSFLHGRPQYAGGALVAKSAGPGASLAAHTRPDADTPTVEVIKQGDKVARIVVTCSCGERIDLECIYPPGAEG